MPHFAGEKIEKVANVDGASNGCRLLCMCLQYITVYVIQDHIKTTSNSMSPIFIPETNFKNLGNLHTLESFAQFI